MPVLAWAGAKIENDGVCNGLYWCKFWSVFVFASELARIETTGMYLFCTCTYQYFAPTQYHSNTS